MKTLGEEPKSFSPFSMGGKRYDELRCVFGSSKSVKRHFTANSNITFFLRDLPVLRQFIAKKSFFYYGKITLFLKKRRPFQVLSA